MNADSPAPRGDVIQVPPAGLAEAAEASRATIERGELIVFPTDTVYGIAADTFNEQAILRLFEAKGRPRGMPIPILVASPDNVGVLVHGDLAPYAHTLFDKFWPGALTVIVPRSRALPEAVAGGGATIGLRLPDSDVACGIIEACGGALATTSANLTTQPPACEVADLTSELLAHVALVVDGGRCPGGTASTVLDLTQSPPKVLREGPVSHDALSAILGEVQ